MTKLKRQLSQFQGAFLHLQNIRKGSRLSRIGRYLVAKFNARYLTGLLLALVIPLGSLANPALSQTNWHENPTIAAPPNVVDAVPQNISLETNNSIQLPLTHFYISQGYHFFHQAIDLAAPAGTPIRPIADGQIAVVSYNGFGLGNYIVIRHSANFYSVYAHLLRINVKKNDWVKQKDVIGAVGSTGHSTGPHLHLETIVDNQKINPLTILPHLPQ